MHEELLPKGLLEVFKEGRRSTLEILVVYVLLEARKAAKLTQVEIARRMGVMESAVSRLESSLKNKFHLPLLNTLRKYTNELGCRLEIKLTPIRKSPQMKIREKIIVDELLKAHDIVNADCNDVKEERMLFIEILKSRKLAKLTQAEVARRMGVNVSAISRMESTYKKKRYFPSVDTLHKYADAVNCRLKIYINSPFTLKTNKILLNYR